MLPVPKISPSAGPDPADTGARIKTVAAGLLAAAIVVGFLHVGRDVLIPLALATLISFALGPLISWLRRFVGLKVAVGLSIVVAVLLVGGIAFLLSWQLADLAANLPKYRSNLQQKIEDLRGGGGLIAEAIGAVREFIDQVNRPQAAAGAPAPTPQPLRVEIQSATALETVAAFLMPVLVPLLLAGLIIVLVVFMLAEREPLRDRLIHLISRGDISRTMEAINDAATRLSRFLAAQVLINLGFGIVIGAGLWFVGMPNSFVWGLLGAILRFVPYAGSLITAIVPTLVAVAVSPGWTLPLLTFGLIVACEIVVGQVVEPLRYGSSTGMSPLAVLVSAMTWAALWGPIGLLLAMPLTVCLIVIGRHVPQLEFLGVLLGDEPMLPPETQIYHRLLSRSPFDAIEVAVDYAHDKGVLPLIDAVLMPLLLLAESDRRRGTLDEQRQRLVAEGIEEIVTAVSDEPDSAPDDRNDEAGKPGQGDGAEERGPQDGAEQPGQHGGVEGPRPEGAEIVCALCVGGRSDLDRAAAVLAAEVLNRRHVRARACALNELANLVTAEDPQLRIDTIALCVLLPGSTKIMDHLLRRIRQHYTPEVPVMMGTFAPDAVAPAAGATQPSCPSARTVDGLADLVAEAHSRKREAA